MGKAIMLALTNPISKDRDEEFNNWYNDVHARDLMALPGFHSIERFRLVQQLLPQSESGEVAYRYLAMYQVDDAAEAVDLIIKSESEFQMSETLDFTKSFGGGFEKVFSLTKEQAQLSAEA